MPAFYIVPLKANVVAIKASIVALMNLYCFTLMSGDNRCMWIDLIRGRQRVEEKAQLKSQSDYSGFFHYVALCPDGGTAKPLNGD